MSWEWLYFSIRQSLKCLSFFKYCLSVGADLDKQGCGEWQPPWEPPSRGRLCLRWPGQCERAVVFPSPSSWAKQEQLILGGKSWSLERPEILRTPNVSQWDAEISWGHLFRLFQEFFTRLQPRPTIIFFLRCIYGYNCIASLPHYYSASSTLLYLVVASCIVYSAIGTFEIKWCHSGCQIFKLTKARYMIKWHCMTVCVSRVLVCFSQARHWSIHIIDWLESTHLLTLNPNLSLLDWSRFSTNPVFPTNPGPG